LDDGNGLLCCRPEHVFWIDGLVKGASGMAEKLTTWSFEVLVCEKTDREGEVIRPATIIDRKDALLEQPTREDLLMQYAAAIKALNAPAAEVVINIVPFAR
jgi:hypothetical protein